MDRSKGSVFLHMEWLVLIMRILKLEFMLPPEYEHLQTIASILPDSNASPVHPFVGLVVNLNVITTAHRDSKDDTVCLVLALGDFEEGELCLYEPGLVIPLQHGHFVVSLLVTSHISTYITGVVGHL